MKHISENLKKWEKIVEENVKFQNSIKPLKAFAIVRTDRPKLKVTEIYETKDIELMKGEKFIEVLITKVG